MRTPVIITAVAGALLLTGCGEDSASVLAPGGDQAAARSASSSVSHTNAQLAAIHELQSAFHGAIRNSDADAMLALWTDDATLELGGTSHTGPEDITAVIEEVAPFVNGWAALAPTYKTRIELHGNRAEYAFECVYVEEPADGDLTGNPVLAHLHTTGVMRKVGDEWLFERFVAGVGPLP